MGIRYKLLLTLDLGITKTVQTLMLQLVTSVMTYCNFLLHVFKIAQQVLFRVPATFTASNKQLISSVIMYYHVFLEEAKSALFRVFLWVAAHVQLTTML